MRPILITAGVLVVLIVAFVTFLLTQKTSVPVVKKNAGPASLPALHETTPGGSSFGAGEGSWVQTFDKKTGELVNEFRADHFDPPVDNRVHVEHPDARFYAKDGQVLTLKAINGDITMAQSARRDDKLGSMQAQPPSHGTLYDVTLGLLETPESTVPVMTCKMPIVEFDNDRLQLNTVPLQKKDGTEIPADQIPVTVRGRDYDFDGRGLTVRYNQRDRRLEFLEVNHGERLLIKNAKAFGGMPMSTAMLEQPLSDANGPIQLAAADGNTAPQLTAEEREKRRQRHLAAERKAAHGHVPPATKPATSRPHEIAAYKATFNENVRIKEGDAPLADADMMNATFTFEQQHDGATTRPNKPVVAPSPSVQPATRPVRRTRTTQPGQTPAGANAVVQPTTRPVLHHGPRMATRPAVAPTSAPMPATTRPARRVRPATTVAAATTSAPTPSAPIEIRWVGKLTVVPEKLADSGLRSTSDRIVEFFGKPAHLTRQGSSVVAAYVWAAVEGNRFRAAPDATTPVVTMKNADGTTLVTESVESDGDDAVLHGKSSADVTLVGDVPKTMHTTWTDLATLRTHAAEGGQRQIERATFRGHVVVEHPQLNMTSDTLALGFAPPADKPTADGKQPQAQLSAVRADGNVHAKVTGDDGNVQTIASATLDLGTAQNADGTLAVRSMHAHGDVVAGDAKQTLRTDDLATTLAATSVSAKDPGSAPSFAVDTLTATGNVIFTSTDGQAATADRLTVDKAADVQWVTLYGTPAKFHDAQSGIAGNTIRVDAAGTHANIDGPGTMTAVQKSADAGKASQPVQVDWTDSMVFNGQTNAARILGDVVVTSHGADGTINHAHGKTLDVAFADAPSTQPAKTPATRPASSQPFAFGGGGSKQVKSLTLYGEGDKEPVEISSLLYSPTDATKLVRRTYLYAPAVTVETNPDGSPGVMDVPSGGEMLYEDMTPATQPSTKPAATAPSKVPAGASSLHGIVALQWGRSMHYDPKVGQAILEGDVKVKHRSPTMEETEMLAPRLVAEIAPGSTPQGGQFKKMTADQGATLFGRKMRIDAPRAVYEPANDRITATGTPRQPVLWSEENGISHGAIAELVWNVRTNQPERVKDASMEYNH